MIEKLVPEKISLQLKLQTEAFARSRGKAGIQAFQEYMSLHSDAEGACALAALVTVFGPEYVNSNEENFSDPKIFVEKVISVTKSLDLELHQPRSVNEFLELMRHESTIGALIFPQNDHAVGIVPYGPEDSFGWSHFKVDNDNWSVLTDHGLSKLFKRSFHPRRWGVIPVHVHAVFTLT